MFCLLCGSGNQAELTAEMIIHFSGLKNLDKPGVWVFPKVFVCLDCGYFHFTVAKRELASIAHTLGISSPTSEASAGDAALSCESRLRSEVEIGSCLWVTDECSSREDCFHCNEKVGSYHILDDVAQCAQTKGLLYQVGRRFLRQENDFWILGQDSAFVERLRFRLGSEGRCPAQSNPVAIPPSPEELPVRRTLRPRPVIPVLFPTAQLLPIF
jgi:hypothetical protein